MCYTIMFVALELVFWSFADDLLHRWKMPVYLWSNVDLRLFAYHQGVYNGIKQYNEWGVHMKMGVVYALAVAAILLYGVIMGNYDITTALEQLKQYWKSLEGLGSYNYM